MSSVTWEDLQCGEAINVYGRHLLLMACDSSTKEWYSRRAIKQRTLTVSHGEVEVRKQAERVMQVEGWFGRTPEKEASTTKYLTAENQRTKRITRQKKQGTAATVSGT